MLYFTDQRRRIDINILQNVIPIKILTVTPVGPVLMKEEQSLRNTREGRDHWLIYMYVLLCANSK